jgi:hypothetical protein
MPTEVIRPRPPRNGSLRAHPHASSGGGVKRATYTVESRQRVLFTVSVDGATKLIDAPSELYTAAATGVVTPDTFIVEPQFADGDAAELEAIVADYLEQAALHARVPMSFSRLGDFLEALAE